MAAKTPRKTVSRKKKSRNVAWFVYLLECRGGTLYTGIALDVAARFSAHCKGRGAAYTRSHPPLRILAAMRCKDRGSALSAEYALKQLRRPIKLLWAAQWPYDARPMQQNTP